MKKILLGTIATIAGFMFTSNADAATLNELRTDAGFKTLVTVTGEDSNATITLNKNAELDIVIEDNQNVTLDLGDFTLTNSKTPYCTGCAAITVAKTASLTIKGNGTIKRSDDAMGNASTIDSKGKLIIEGGTIEASQGSGPGGSAAVFNDGGTFEMTGGTIKTTTNNVWGINNAGTATISNGTFIQGGDYSVVLNEKTMDIQNGTFKTEGPGAHNSLISNGVSNESANLTIENGTFNNGSTILWNGDAAKGKNGGNVTITGGTYSDPNAIAAYLGNGYTIENGQIVKETPQVTTETQPAPAKTANAKLDDVPKTGNTLPYTLLGFMALVLGASVYTYAYAETKK